MTPTAPDTADINLGVAIKNPKARRFIYGAYAIVATVVGATVVGFAVAGALPAWLEISQAVIAYLAIPIGGLAAANTNTTRRS